MNILKVLIIEDHEDSIILNIRELRRAGFEPVYRCVQTEQAMHSALNEETWDLVISDHDMPNFTAQKALSVFQESGLDVPFIIVSGVIGEEQAVADLKAGAHDFISKRNLARLAPAVTRELGDAENRRKQRKAEKEARERLKEVQMLSGKILHAYEEERTRLARELHDEIGQALTVINLDLQYLQRKLMFAESPLQEKIASSIKLLEQTLGNIRAKILALRPPSLDSIGLVEVIREMAQELSDRTGLSIDFKEKDCSKRLPIDLETALYRCIQEALTNVVRHANATKVELELLKKYDMVSAIIRDNGKGFDPVQLKPINKGVGLAGMQERVKLLGGELQVDTEPGKGTLISINIPFRD